MSKSEANRHAQSKDAVPRCGASGLRKMSLTTGLRQTLAAHLSGGPPIKFVWGRPPSAVQPSAARLADECVRRYANIYCPGITVTGMALAITGPCASPEVASMRITCPGSGGTSPIRRASTSMRSGSRNDASSSRSA